MDLGRRNEGQREFVDTPNQTIAFPASSQCFGLSSIPADGPNFTSKFSLQKVQTFSGPSFGMIIFSQPFFSFFFGVQTKHSLSPSPEPPQFCGLPLSSVFGLWIVDPLHAAHFLLPPSSTLSELIGRKACPHVLN
jgi:hypothetical protein